MLTMIEMNWPAFALVLVLGLAVAWVLWARGAGRRRDRHRGADVLDEGAAPARRNQALIDAPSAAASHSAHASAAARAAAPLAGTGPDIMGGIGEVVAAAAASEVTAAQDAEEVASTDAPAPVTEPAAQTPSTAQAPSAPAAPAGGDDLTRLKGLGPKLSARLRELDVTSFAQIAAWSEADIAAIDAQLGSFAGRPTRDKWVEQARFLASGDTAGYEAQFGKM